MSNSSKHYENIIKGKNWFKFFFLTQGGIRLISSFHWERWYILSPLNLTLKINHNVQTIFACKHKQLQLVSLILIFFPGAKQLESTLDLNLVSCEWYNEEIAEDIKDHIPWTGSTKKPSK